MNTIKRIRVNPTATKIKSIILSKIKDGYNKINKLKPTGSLKVINEFIQKRRKRKRRKKRK